jgi:hypothetical protein
MSTEKGENPYAGNYFACRLDIVVTGRNSRLAAQSPVGLLPEWRNWPGRFDSGRTVSSGPDLDNQNAPGLFQERLENLWREKSRIWIANLQQTWSPETQRVSRETNPITSFIRRTK